MGYCLLPEAEAELDDIWLYVARASGSIEISHRLIDAITEQLSGSIQVMLTGFRLGFGLHGWRIGGPAG